MASADPLAQRALDGCSAQTSTISASRSRPRAADCACGRRHASASSSSSSTTTTSIGSRTSCRWSGSRATSGRSRPALLRPGTPYGVRVDGPLGAGNTLQPRDASSSSPTRRVSSAAAPTSAGRWSSMTGFDWGGVRKPAIPLDRTVLYEAHVKGLTKRHPQVPAALRGTYAGLAHPAMIAHFHDAGHHEHRAAAGARVRHRAAAASAGPRRTTGATTPSTSSRRMRRTRRARAPSGGPEAVLREFKGMVQAAARGGPRGHPRRRLQPHGRGGPRRAPLELPRHRQRSRTTGSTTTARTSTSPGAATPSTTATDAAARLVLDSLRYWANDLQIDGFRFDLAATLGRDDTHSFTPEHPLLQAIVDDPALAGVKMIAEPWDVGMGGWQTGNFPTAGSSGTTATATGSATSGCSDVDYARRASGVAGRHRRLRARASPGSANTFSAERGPLASVNFVTAHDGFTARTIWSSYDVKHNLGNGEHNRDGADTNRSFNHGIEGADRRRGDPGDAPQGDAQPARHAPAVAPASRCSPPATSSAARSAATTTPTATTRR